jgi:hypothetical protein
MQFDLKSLVDGLMSHVTSAVVHAPTCTNTLPESKLGYMQAQTVIPALDF